MRRPLVIVVGMGLAVVVGRGVQGAGPSCGDVNGDSVINLTDPVCILSFLFLSGPAPECAAGSISCANVNGDDLVNLSDAVYLLNRLFLGGPDLLCAGGPQEIPGFTFTRMNVQGYPEYLHDQTGILLVLLSAEASSLNDPWLTHGFRAAFWPLP